MVGAFGHRNPGLLSFVIGASSPGDGPHHGRHRVARGATEVIMNPYRWLNLHCLLSLDPRTLAIGRPDRHRLLAERRRNSSATAATTSPSPRPSVPAGRIFRGGATPRRLLRLLHDSLPLSPRSLQELRLLWIAVAMAAASFALSMLVAALNF